MNARDLQKTAQFILDCEARRDRQGRLRVYRLDRADRGGTFEVAGINDRFHPDMAHKLRGLIERQRYLEAERVALDYLAEYTGSVAEWSRVPAIEAFLRDAAFNRGAGGAAKILQIALRVPADGRVGPVTRAALRSAERHPNDLIDQLFHACAVYERRIAPPVGERAKYWNGLVNRWGRRRAFALSLV